MNTRTDEYGGSLQNRARFLRELLEDAHDAAGDTCAIACRIAVDQLLGPKGLTFDGEGREVIELLAELPDLWDVNLADWSNDSVTARFADEGAQERYTAFVKSVTSKPVVAWPFHLARRHGQPDPARRARPDRGSQAIDRRSVPAGQGARRPARRYP
ncbi:MAG: hypothetical protein WDN06_12100 [Asticcacaulis sp.]